MNTPIRELLKLSVRERLVHFVQTLERQEEEKAEVAAAISETLRLAASMGFDKTTLKVVLKLRKLTPEERKQRRALEAIYMASLGMLEGEALPDEARRRLEKPDQDAPAPSAPPSTSSSLSPLDATAKKDRKPEPAPQQVLPLKDPAEARQEGVAAAKAGKGVFANPYPAGDPCRAAWDEGWCEGDGSHGMSSPAAFQRRKEKPPEPPEKPEDRDNDDEE